MRDSPLIIIPCLNEAAQLPSLLAQLLRDSPDAPIVVADGGSSDRSRGIVAEVARDYPNVVLMDNPDRLQSAGVNRAVATYAGDRRWFVRVDAHCRYPEGYVSRLVEAAARRDVVSVVVPMVTEGHGCFQIGCAAAQNSLLGTGGSAHRHIGRGQFVEHGHHALMAVDAFKRVGGYNEAMSHNEDAELDCRLATEGRIWLEPACAITYFPRRTPRALWRQYYGYGKGRAQTIALHRLRPRLRQMAPLAVPIALLLAIFGAPLSPLFLVPLIGWAALCLGIGGAIAIRSRSLCSAAAGPAAMIMHLAWGCGYLIRRFGIRTNRVSQ